AVTDVHGRDQRLLVLDPDAAARGVSRVVEPRRKDEALPDRAAAEQAERIAVVERGARDMRAQAMPLGAGLDLMPSDLRKRQRFTDRQIVDRQQTRELIAFGAWP